MSNSHLDAPQEVRFGDQVTAERSMSFLQRIGSLQSTPVVAATVVIFIVSAIFVPRSLTQASFIAMIVPAAVLAIAAVGQTLVVQQKGIDLAAPGFITLAAVIAVYAPQKTGVSAGVAVLLAVLASAVGGWLNGFFVTRLNVTPIISSLALNSILFGAVFTICGGAGLNAPSELTWFSKTPFLGLPLLVWIVLVLIVVTAIFMAKSSVGRRFVGVGSSPEAARATGVKVNRYIVGSYVVSGLFSGIAGVLLVSYLGKSSATIGVPYLFPIISAVVVGGAALAGGRGSVIASAVAAVFLSQVVQMALTLGATESVRLMIDSLAILVASLIRVVPWRQIFKRRVQPAHLNAQAA